MRVEPFEPAHLHALTLQPHQAHTADTLRALAEIVAGLGPAWTALEGEEVIACAGIAEGEVWTLLGEGAGPHMLAMTRAVRRGLLLAGDQRLVAFIDPHFAPAARWAKMMGFRFAADSDRPCAGGHMAQLWMRD